MKQFLIMVMCLFFMNTVVAQDNALMGSKVNQKDAKGRKQGIWKKKYKNGNLAYEVRFKDDSPIGTYKRFHPNGELKAHLEYNEKAFASAKFYDRKGKLVSEGFYRGKQKDSVWRYYSANDSLRLLEHYKNGKLNGRVESFFDSGKVAEFYTYKDGVKNGLWRQLYETGKTRAEANFTDGLREGATNFFYPNGRFEIKGRYKQDQRHGKWEFFDPRGKLHNTIMYEMGKQDSDSEDREHKKLIEQEKNKGKIADPKNFMNNPMEYIRKSGN